jgi:hypothetical protein
MGFYLRKSFSVTKLLRLNLSGSGLGLSFGVPGARIGMGPRGSYIHVGRGGLYYRQRLSGGRANPSRVLVTPEPLPEVDSGPTAEMRDASADDLLEELNRVHKRVSLLPFVLSALVVAAAVWCYFAVVWSQAPAPAPVSVPQLNPRDERTTAEVLREKYVAARSVTRGISSTPATAVHYGVLGVIVILGGLLGAWARRVDVAGGTAILDYELEQPASKWFQELEQAMASLAACDRVWHVFAKGDTSDWKRNAGASALVERTVIVPSVGLPKRVQSNVVPISLPAGKQTLYFFPDRLLIYESSSVGAVSYGDLRATLSESHFREVDDVPSDAELMEYTWRFVAKSGGPDRRFNNNTQIPVLRYGQLHLTSHTGLNEVFQFSKANAADSLVRVLDRSSQEEAETTDANR